MMERYRYSGRLPSRNGILLIKRWESWSAAPYLCPAGWWPIGWVCTRGLDGRSITGEHPPISEFIGMAMIWREVMLAVRAVNSLCPVQLETHQLDALTSFTYNLGSGNLQASTLRRMVMREDHQAAAKEFPRWVFAGGRKLRGLVYRREAEAALFRGEVRAAMSR